jgi:hypothetical protein
VTDIDEIRCPSCEARNPSTAPWCNQCYASLAAPEPPTPPEPSPPATSVPAPPTQAATEQDGLLPLPPSSPGATRTGDAGEPRQLRSGSGRFRQAADGLEWSCATCDEWNPIERVTCTVCQVPFGPSADADASPSRPEVAAPVLVVSSLIAPGAGQWLLGLRGAAVLRLLLAAVWGLGGLSLLLRAQSSGQPALPAFPLLLGWAIVAAGSANDAVVESGGTGTVVLHGRVLLWLTVAVIGGTLGAAFIGVLGAVGG